MLDDTEPFNYFFYMNWNAARQGTPQRGWAGGGLPHLAARYSYCGSPILCHPYMLNSGGEGGGVIHALIVSTPLIHANFNMILAIGFAYFNPHDISMNGKYDFDAYYMRVPLISGEKAFAISGNAGESTVISMAIPENRR